MQSSCMKRLRPLPMIAFVLLLAASAAAQTSPPLPKAGETYEIIKSYTTAQETSDDFGSRSSRGSDRIIERVLEVRNGGVELEYDFPKGSGAEERAVNWQLPARLFRSANGSMTLLNRSELEARLAAWLKAAGLAPEACGRWYFTWNAFRVECDPHAVVEAMEAIDLRSVELRDGATYRVADAAGPGVMTRTAGKAGGAKFSAVMPIDPEAVRQARAETDVVLGEIAQKPKTLQAALLDHAGEDISGTIEVTLDVKPDGTAWRRTTLTKRQIKTASDTVTEVLTQTVERLPTHAIRKS